jgi:anti-sigma B factor antagonist
MGWDKIKMALFRRWTKNHSVEAGEATIEVLRANSELTVAVAGRVTIDSSPHLRSVLLDLLRRDATPALAIDLSRVSYLDTSGIATLIEVSKIAHEHSAPLRLVGISGELKTITELTGLDRVFRALGSEVKFS